MDMTATNYSLFYRLKQWGLWLSCVLYNNLLLLYDRLYCLFNKEPYIVSPEETLKYIWMHKCSVARYGDGEMKLIRGIDMAFQRKDSRMGNRLTQILQGNSKKLIVCLPGVFGNLSAYRDYDRKNWAMHLAKTRSDWYKFINKEIVYYDAFISRFYMPYKDKSRAPEMLKLWKMIWEGRDILIVEGEKTRLGIGNDLFDNVHSIKRVLCPNIGAFAIYDKILNEVRNFSTGNLVLLALGPTATIMAADLSEEGYQAIDVGHIDVEYEWMRGGATEKVAVTNKYVNEAVDGKDIGECEDPEYQKQIVASVKGV